MNLVRHGRSTTSELGLRRHESPPSTREFCPLLFQKALDWVGEETGLTPSTKWLACGYYAVVFNKTKVFLIVIILRWKVHPQKTINGKRNFKRSLSFPFVDKRNQFLTKLFFVELKLVFCLVERLACFWNNQGTQLGYFGFSSDWDDRMGAKIPETSNKPPH